MDTGESCYVHCQKLLRQVAVHQKRLNRWFLTGVSQLDRSSIMSTLTSIIIDKSGAEHRRLAAEHGATLLRAQLEAHPWPRLDGSAVADLACSGLTAQTIAENELWTTRGAALGKFLGQPEGQELIAGEALAITYFNIDGSPQPDGRGIGLQRVRLYGAALNLFREPGGKSPPKYRAAVGSSAGIYIPAAVRKSAMAGTVVSELIVTEGEKKALAITQEGRFAVAIPGVTQWANPLARQAMRADDRDEPMSEDTALHPVLLEVLGLLKVQKVLVVADSDARSNPLVRKSMSKLARAVHKQTSARAIYFAVPAVADETGKKAKTGLDDWLVRVGRGGVLAQLQAAFDGIPERSISVGGYAPLGYCGTESVVWSHARQCIMRFAPKDLNENNLMVAVGASWALEHYSQVTEAGARRVDVSSLKQELLDACQLQGHYGEHSVRGAGVWAAEDGLVVNSGSSVWHSDGHSICRVTDGRVYPAGRNLEIGPSTEVATAADVEAVQTALMGWNFLNPDDRWLLLGWLFVATLVGTLEQRANLILTGAKGCGKTELQYLVAGLLGGSAIAVDGKSTAAGIRQSLGTDALSIVIDEFESAAATDRGAHRVQDVVDMFRSAYSAREASAGVLRGSADGRAMSYSIRTCALMSMVVPPRLESADESRIAIVRLGTLANGARVPVLAADTHQVKVLGQRLRRLAIDQYRNFAKSMHALKNVMLSRGDDGRFIGTFGTLLVGGWLLVERRAMTEHDAAEVLARLSVSAHRQRVTESTDERECTSWMLGHLVRSAVDGKSMEVTVSELVEAAGNGRKDAGRLLERYGVKLSQDGTELLIAAAASGAGLRKMFGDSKFANGGHASVLRRIPGAREATPRFCGDSVRAIAIPMTYVRAEVSGPGAATQPSDGQSASGPASAQDVN